MSGPKIIDVAATRHHEHLRIITQCRRLDVLMKTYSNLCSELGITSSVDESIVKKIRHAASQSESINELIALREQTNGQVEFIRSEMNRVREIASRQKAAEHQISESIEQLLSSTANAETKALLLQATSSNSNAKKMELFDLALEKEESKETTKVDSELIRQWLCEIGETKPQKLPKKSEARWKLEVAQMRAESSMLGHDVTEEVEVAILKIASETDKSRRAAAIDDLRITLSEALSNARTIQNRHNQIAEWESMLKEHADFLDFETWKARLSEDKSITSNEVDHAIETAIEEASAIEARREILNTLIEMGYEVRTGMETAFVENGRLILKKPSAREFGVEFSTLPNGSPSLLKTRVVRLKGTQATTEGDRLRDKEQEDAWCNDRKVMEAMLAERGINSEIKAARKAGESPVEVVFSEDVVSDTLRREAPSQKIEKKG